MQTHWDDTSFDELPSRRRERRAHQAGIAKPAACSPPPHFQEELKVPYLKIRGRWLRQMGFDVGRKLQIEACAGVITIKLLGPPAVEDPGCPGSWSARSTTVRSMPTRGSSSPRT